MQSPTPLPRRPLLQLIVLLAASAGFTAATGTSKPAWERFTSTSEHLSVLMPGKPEAHQRVDKSFVGDITTFEHSARDGRDTYSVDYTILPGFAISFSGKDGIYEHAKSDVLKTTLSKPISFTDVTLDGIEGKKLLYDTPSKPGHPEMQGEARFFLVDDHLYTVDAVVEMDGAEEKLDRFFSSLKISK